MTLPLPPSYEWGKVVGRVIHAIADTAADADCDPEARAAVGTVTFSPLTTLRTADGAFVSHGPEVVSLDSSGYLVDAEGEQGVWLITGSYRVQFTLDAGARVSPFDVTVSTDHTDVAPLVLSEAAPYVPDGDTTTTLAIAGSPFEGAVVAFSDGAARWEASAVGVTDHGELTGLSDDDHAQYALADGSRGAFAATSHTHTIPDVTGLQAALDAAGASGGVTDHGALTGLADDDHTQYALADGSRGDFAPTIHTHPASQIGDSTTVGQALMTAADAAAARAAIGAAAAGTIGAITVSGTPTSGQVPTATSGTTATWQDPAGSSLPVNKASGYHLILPATATTQYASWAANRLYMAPVFLPAALTLASVICNVTSAGSADSVIRWGVYGATATGDIDMANKIAEVLFPTGASTGNITVTQAIDLPAGILWLAHVEQGTTIPGAKAFAHDSQGAFGHRASANWSIDTFLTRYLAGVTGALPTAGSPSDANEGGTLAVMWGIA